MSEETAYSIREIGRDALEQSGAPELVWRVFLEFEAPDYPEEGIREFRDYIAPDAMAGRMENGELLLWGCFSGGGIVGVIAARPPCHISLLFVDREHHRRGIARGLLRTVPDWYEKNTDHSEITVNSSPFAAEAYRRLGFADTGPEQTVNGLRFISMKHRFR